MIPSRVASPFGSVRVGTSGGQGMGANAASRAEVQNALKGAGLLEKAVKLLTLFTPPPSHEQQHAKEAR